MHDEGRILAPLPRRSWGFVPRLSARTAWYGVCSATGHVHPPNFQAIERRATQLAGALGRAGRGTGGGLRGGGGAARCPRGPGQRPRICRRVDRQGGRSVAGGLRHRDDHRHRLQHDHLRGRDRHRPRRQPDLAQPADQRHAVQPARGHDQSHRHRRRRAAQRALLGGRRRPLRGQRRLVRGARPADRGVHRQGRGPLRRPGGGGTDAGVGAQRRRLLRAGRRRLQRVSAAHLLRPQPLRDPVRQPGRLARLRDPRRGLYPARRPRRPRAAPARPLADPLVRHGKNAGTS